MPFVWFSLTYIVARSKGLYNNVPDIIIYKGVGG